MDWMYKGLTGIVDNESYLLGRSVDKTFDQIQNEKEKKKVDLESGLARRSLPDDPLVAIKKKEIETRQQLLKNPVKVKKIKEMLRRKQKMELDKNKKKNRKEELEINFDKIIVEMYQSLKEIYHVHSLEELINIKLDEENDEQCQRSKLSHEEKLNRKIEKKLEKHRKTNESDLDSERSSEDEKNKKKETNENKKKSDSEANIVHRKHYMLKRKEIKKTRHKDSRGVNKYTKNSNIDTHSSDSGNENKRNERSYTKRKYNNYSDDESNGGKKSRKTSNSESCFKDGKEKTNASHSKENKRRKSDQLNLNKHKKGHHSMSRREKSPENKSTINHNQEILKNNEDRSDLSDSSNCQYKEGMSKKNKKQHTRRKKSEERTMKNRQVKNVSDEEASNKYLKPSKVHHSSGSSSDQSSSEVEKRKQEGPRKKYGLLLPEKYKATVVEKSENSHREKVSILKPTEEAKQKSLSNHFKVKLSAEEKEQKLKEMMDNARWRDDLREQNIKQYKKESEKESHGEKFEKDKFMRKQLSIAAENSTVESRLKSNVNNIQRSSHAMSSSFDRRL